MQIWVFNVWTRSNRVLVKNLGHWYVLCLVCYKMFFFCFCLGLHWANDWTEAHHQVSTWCAREVRQVFQGAGSSLWAGPDHHTRRGRVSPYLAGSAESHRQWGTIYQSHEGGKGQCVQAYNDQSRCKADPTTATCTGSHSTNRNPDGSSSSGNPH